MTASGAGAPIAVDGATGYLGNHVVAELRRRGAVVHCITHSGARQRDIDFLESTGAQVFVAELSGSNTALMEALKGCRSVVHLVGSIAPKKGEKLEELHAGQTRGLVEACQQAGVSKIVQVTALGTASDAASAYHQTKWAAEEVVRQSGLSYVILRPSLIIGREVGNRDSKLISRYKELIEQRNSVPLIDGGDNKLQPVFVGDLAAALAAAATDCRYDNQVCEIGGPEVVSMRQIVEKLMKLLDKQRAIKDLPPFLASLLASVLQLVQDVPLISKDQIILATRDNICSRNALHETFGISATGVDDALSTYGKTGAPSAGSEASV